MHTMIKILIMTEIWKKIFIRGGKYLKTSFAKHTYYNCSAKLLLCGSAQMTELFSTEHRTFFCITFNANGILFIIGL